MVGLHRLDMVIDRKLVVEVKSTADLRKEAGRQLYNYLKASKIEVGLLLVPISDAGNTARASGGSGPYPLSSPRCRLHPNA